MLYSTSSPYYIIKCMPELRNIFFNKWNQLVDSFKTQNVRAGVLFKKDYCFKVGQYNKSSELFYNYFIKYNRIPSFSLYLQLIINKSN